VQKADVYEYIVMTLEKAIELLPEQCTEGRLDKYRAKGLLAKVYLTKAGVSGQLNADDLKKAADLASDVMNNSGRELEKNYADVFKLEGNKSKENMIAWRWVVSSQWTSQNTFQSDLGMTGMDEYGDVWGEYQQALAEWDAEEAVVRQAHADWENECTRLRQEHDRQVAEAEAWDEDAAVAEWEAAQDADANAYMQRLVHIMEEEEKAGNKDFKNFSKTMDAIESNFKLVAVECAKREGSSPFHAFDSYWARHFNFDTQGYYLRQAYRTNAEFQLRRGYALLASYYDMPSYTGGDYDTDPRESLTGAMTNALNGIEALPAGISPDDLLGAAFVTRGFYLNRNVYSYTLGRSFNLTMFSSSLASTGIGDFYTDEQVKAYCSRLHGRTVAEDLRLAGLMLDYDANWNNWLAERGGYMSPQNYLGLGVNHEVVGDRWVTRYVPFDAKGYQLREYDEDNHHGVIFLLNN
jgi:hypothetical protein